ncbi:hypothetical protein MLD38_040300 [Melastoma candidum]|uniref:Uncharacterized protein n=1 Tax=Melastoma candidum TaxID=119954 RepID=A0ACB9L5Q9_9MYRT|nr:hypothetical protein MLD38_040300 [Melastoma candidum]
MGRGRAKKSKVSSGTDHEDSGICGEEKVPQPKRRGRPQKIKGDIVVVAGFIDKFQEEGLHVHDAANDSIIKEIKSPEEANSDSNEYDVEAKSSSEDLTKLKGGFRHSGSRRKSKPRRAAEVGVGCQWNWF